MSLQLMTAADDALPLAHEINVTPFIDVMLVLLIIFMVAAPLATVDIAVDLPASRAAAAPRPAAPVFLTLRQDLSLALGALSVSRAELKTALHQATGGDTERRLFLRADQSVAYGELMQVMTLLQSAGYLKVALVTVEEAAPGQAAR